MITIKEIAELAGVSRGTVDRVLNKRGGVNRAVEERINRMVEQYGYKPNKTARALVNRKRLFTIGVISATVENVFFRDVLEGIRRAEEEVRELGISLRYMEVAKFSVAEQLRCMDEMLAQGIDALAIAPINAVEIRDRLLALHAQDIPVITFNSDIEDVEKLAYIGCDYKKTGRIAAGLIAFNNVDPVKIGIVTGSTRSLGHCLRVEGFCREMEKCYPGMEVVRIVEMFDDEITSYSKVGGLLSECGDINAFFFAAGGKEGGIRAICEAGKGGRTRIVTVDIDPFTRKCIEEGVVSATICQQPFVQGHAPVHQLANYLLHGESPEKRCQYTQAEIVIRQCL